MANVKITVPMFRGINIFDQEVVGQLLVVGDTACIIPLNGARGDWNKNFMCFDGHHLTQGMYDEALWIRDPSTIHPAGAVEVEVC